MLPWCISVATSVAMVETPQSSAVGAIRQVHYRDTLVVKMVNFLAFIAMVINCTARVDKISIILISSYLQLNACWDWRMSQERNFTEYWLKQFHPLRSPGLYRALSEF